MFGTFKKQVARLLTLSTLVLVLTPVYASTLPSPFTASDVESIIRHQKLETIEDVLKTLPSEFTNHFVLLYESRSLHGSSFETPRIVFFSKDGRMVLAAAGSAAMTNGNELEMIDFNDADKSFNFHQVSFSKDGSPPVIHDVNSPLCLSCHRERRSPNWEAYPIWPGSYGSIRVDEEPEALAETTGFQHFIQNSAGLGRYAYLGKDVTQLSLEDFNTANLAMSQAFGDLNESRLIHELRENPDLHRFMNVLAGIQNGCPDIASFFPPTLSPAFDPEAYGAFISGIGGEALAHYKSDLRLAAQMNGEAKAYDQDVTSWIFEFSVLKFSGAAFILKTYLGFDANPYTLRIDGGSAFYSHETFSELLLHLLPANFSKETCTELAQHSQETLR